MQTHIIILAGGKGTRMQSEKPKVLMQVAGASLITRVLDAVRDVCPKPTLIVGYKAGEVVAETHNQYHYAYQEQQLGTGHAVLCAENALAQQPFDAIVVLNGDHPLITSATVKAIISSHEKSEAVMSLATVRLPHFEDDLSMFKEFGRIVRGHDGSLRKIVEARDASETERALREVNINCYCFNASWLWHALHLITNENKAREYYLTDTVKVAFDQHKKINSYVIENPIEAMGVNTREQLACIEKYALLKQEALG